MIYVSQGHEKSISLEIFIKSFLLLPPRDQELFTLVVEKESLEENLYLLKYKYGWESDRIEIGKSQLKVLLTEKSPTIPRSTTSLELALRKARPGNDILLTLPTSKDQLIKGDKSFAGYTEFLRSYWGNPDLAMVFHSDKDSVLLVTDHIPLGQVIEKVKAKAIISKVVQTLEPYQKYFHSIDQVLLAGINPHAGEKGILGHEDQEVNSSIEELKLKYPQVKFEGPCSGDILYLKNSTQKRSLLVYMFHDQGLSAFKAKNHWIGINVTLGGPLLRMSVDHGTAFDLYGKGKARETGALFLIRNAASIHRKINF